MILPSAQSLLIGAAACAVSAVLGAAAAWRYADARHDAEMSEVLEEPQPALMSLTAHSLPT